MNNSQTQVVYLEQTVEQFFFIPTELSRMLNTIKALDERCNELSDSLQDCTAQLLAMPPAYQAPPGPEYFDLMKRLGAEQKMLTQFGEEKVQLAQQAYDLLEMHALELERTMENFESDMRITGQLDGVDLGMLGSTGSGALGSDGAPGSGSAAEMFAAAGITFDAAAAAAVQQNRVRTPKLEDWNLPTPADVFDSLPLPLAPGLPPAPPAAVPPAASAGPGHRRMSLGQSQAPGSSIQRSSGHKRQRSEDPPVPAAAAPPSSAAPAQAAAATAAPQPAPTGAPTAPVLPNAQGPTPAPAVPAPPPPGGPAAGPPPPSTAAPDGTQAPPAPHGPGTGPALPVTGVAFLTPPPFGLQAQAPQPQAPGGTLLTAADVGPGLRGRHAELYWPADSLWYIIEIQDIDVVTMKARIVYTTGEVEELDMDEIAREGHMMLVPLELYAGRSAAPLP